LSKAQISIILIQSRMVRSLIPLFMTEIPQYSSG
jgi:hypothetical protein